MPKTVYADVTNKNKLTVILLAAALAVGGLVVSGTVHLPGFPGRTPEGALLDAQANVERKYSATRTAQARHDQETGTAQARYHQDAATAQVQYDLSLTAAAHSATAAAVEATATHVQATAIAASQATSTAYPPTATAQAAEATANAEGTAISWMATTEAGTANATATVVAALAAEKRENAKVMQGWLIAVLVFLAFASSVASIILIVRIWFIHIKPLIALKGNVGRINSMARMVPGLCRRLQEMEESRDAEDQGETAVA